MITETKAKEYVCDGCGSSTLVEVGNDGYPIEPVLGYYLDVSWVHGGGGDGRSYIYACKKRCIPKAIDNAFARRE